MMLPFISFIVSLIKTLFILKIPKFEVIIEYTTRITNGKNTQSSITKLDHYFWSSIDAKTRFSFLKKLAIRMAQFLSKIVICSWAYLGLDPDLVIAHRPIETSAKCINREGLERRRQGLGKAYVISVLQLDLRLPAARKG